jgi:hypothetical protein
MYAQFEAMRERKAAIAPLGPGPFGDGRKCLLDCTRLRLGHELSIPDSDRRNVLLDCIERGVVRS